VARDQLVAQLADERAALDARETELDGMTIAEFVGAPGEKWPWIFTKNEVRRRARREVAVDLHQERQAQIDRDLQEP
jgi:hypothetical protein